METLTKQPLLLYTEQTPNPETLKFVTNRILYKGQADFADENLAKEWSPIAAALFALPYTKGIYISNNFVTITKSQDSEWDEIMLDAKNFIKNFIDNGGEIVKEGFAEVQKEIEEAKQNVVYTGDTAELVERIKELIDKFVKPAVEMDGGNIEFKKFEDGVVHVELQGSCSGCPSSTVTLKSGIEGMLTRMIPEVKEVVSTMG
jgi:NFU1 iron-sulfur cluster scaffold homolog, mitochondrial